MTMKKYTLLIKKNYFGSSFFSYLKQEQEVKTNAKIIQKGLTDSTNGTHLQSSVVYPGYDTNLSNFGKWYLWVGESDKQRRSEKEDSPVWQDVSVWGY